MILGSKIDGNVDHKMIFSFQENAFENVVCILLAIGSLY